MGEMEPTEVVRLLTEAPLTRPIEVLHVADLDELADLRDRLRGLHVQTILVAELADGTGASQITLGDRLQVPWFLGQRPTPEHALKAAVALIRGACEAAKRVTEEHPPMRPFGSGESPDAELAAMLMFRETQRAQALGEKPPTVEHVLSVAARRAGTGPSPGRAFERTPWGARIRDARIEAGLTQAQVAKRLGTDQGRVSKLERTGTGTEPYAAELAALVGVPELTDH